MKSFRIRKNDKVKIIAGKDAGKVGRILRILRKKDAVIVEKANIVKRHTKPNQYAKQQGGIIEKEMPIPVSKVMVLCSACGKATRVGYKYIDSDGKQKKVRFCKKCHEVME